MFIEQSWLSKTSRRRVMFMQLSWLSKTSCRPTMLIKYIASFVLMLQGCKSDVEQMKGHCEILVALLLSASKRLISYLTVAIMSGSQWKPPWHTIEVLVNSPPGFALRLRFSL